MSESTTLGGIRATMEDSTTPNSFDKSTTEASGARARRRFRRLDRTGAATPTRDDTSSAVHRAVHACSRSMPDFDSLMPSPRHRTALSAFSKRNDEGSYGLSPLRFRRARWASYADQLLARLHERLNERGYAAATFRDTGSVATDLSQAIRAQLSAIQLLGIEASRENPICPLNGADRLPSKQTRPRDRSSQLGLYRC